MNLLSETKQDIKDLLKGKDNFDIFMHFFNIACFISINVLIVLQIIEIATK